MKRKEPRTRSLRTIRWFANPRWIAAGLVASGTLLLSVVRGAAGDAASYSGLKPDDFMKNWLILKPIPVANQEKGEPSETEQQKAFAQDCLAGEGGEANASPHAGAKQKIGDNELVWEPVESKADIVDLNAGGPEKDFAIAYAWAEIDMPAKAKGLLGVGSDDAVKVWLNGKVALEKWTTRISQPDDDIVPVEFEKGKNRLLLKIQNVRGGWGFVCRLMGQEAQAQKLVPMVWNQPDPESIKALLDLGLDVNSRGRTGLSAWQVARFCGEKEVADLLASRGADTKAPKPSIEQVAAGTASSLVKEDSPGLAVLIAQDGKILFEKGYGLADVAHHVPITPETKFRIGSITKQFTAAAILKLQEQGKLSVKDKLSKYIPDFPRGDEVTLHHLLTHTSGIHSYTSHPGFLEKVTKPTKTEEIIESIKKDPYDFDPGKKWLYDNSGFLLLGYIVEKVSAENYGDFLRENFFQPLGMTNTGVYRNGTHLDHEALGYEYGDGKFTNGLDWDMSWAGGAGALYSTVEDLYRWNEGMFSGKVISQASLKAAFTPVQTEENKSDHLEDGYGYGLSIAMFRGAQEISHGGGLNGFSSFLLRVPREHLTVVVLANALPGQPGLEPGGMAQRAVEFCVGERLDPRPVFKPNQTVSAKSFDALVGRYDYGGPIMTVTKEGDHLFAQLSGQPRFEIFPRSETEFFWKVADAQVTFVKDNQGKVIKAIHHQNGNTLNAPRLADLRETKVDAASLDAVTGKYDYGEGKAILAVTREGDQVFAQMTGQPKFEIFPKSDNEFFWKVVEAQVTFVKDDKGKVIKAVHHQAGQTLEAPKIE
ncbi:Beta-lactamase (modular protein) [Verrucomicrobia bacterium]|nr:Beta-lactamase (modular protein) [Verrucomicrobiota bacterium]